MYKSPAGMAIMLMSQKHFEKKLFSSKNCALGTKG